jgi:hypothetical protein
VKPRPLGFTLLALAFGWLTIAGLGNAVLNFVREGAFFSPVTGVLCLAYAVTAGFTTVGLWGLREWALTALRLWIVVCVLLLVWFPVGPFRGLGTPALGLAGFAVLVTGLLWLLHHYVTRTLRPAA